MRLVIAFMVAGVALGVLLNVAHGQPWALEGFFFGVLGALFGLLMYATNGHPMRAARRWLAR